MLSRVRKLHFLSLCNAFTEPMRTTLKEMVLSGSSIEFEVDPQFGIIAIVDGERIAARGDGVEAEADISSCSPASV